jgi:two-component system, chemotaxis family, chemotaxis protein CheY
MAVEGTMKTCLLVDDSQTIRVVVREMLTSFGYRVVEAADGAAALAACRPALPELVLLDWNMPVMNGIDFLRALRATPGGGKPAVIFCTTETGIAFIQQGLEAGANEYIMKPFDREILRSKLSQIGAL